MVRILSQYDALRKRSAYLQQYTKEPMFADDLSEFDDSRFVLLRVLELIRIFNIHV